MNPENLRTLRLGMTSLSRLLLPFLIIWLLGAIGLGWLVKSFFIVMGVLLLLPIVAFVGLQWWLKRNLVQSVCPVCQTESMSLNQAEFRCPGCNEPLRAENGQFVRLTPSGTIDVSAVEIPAQTIDE